MEAPMGITKSPRFSWVIFSEKRNTVQKSYELQIAKDEEFQQIVFQKQEDTDDSIHHQYAEFKMESLQKYYWRVKVSDNYGRESDYRVGTFTTALLDNSEWIADFVTVEEVEDKEKSNATYLRKEFVTAEDKTIDRAYVCSTALGLYQLFLDGKKVGDDELTPGWTSYDKHLCYQMYEVTDELKIGTEHCIGALLGVGYYKGKMGFLELRNNYGERTALLAQLHIIYTDGTSDVIYTDKSWMGAESPIVFSEIYDGEIYDARKEVKDWNTINLKADVDEAGRIGAVRTVNGDWSIWKQAQKIDFDKSVLYVQFGSKVREVTKVPAKEIFVTSQGDTVIDFGQNMAGWIHVTVRNAEAGDMIELDCFEALDKDGNVYVENLRGAKNRIVYYCKGDDVEVYYPHFTYQGFRYAKVVAYPGELQIEDVTAYAVHSDMEPIGNFTCSNPELNQLWSNIVWGLKSNFVDIPTDCPQRNERVGWTGDAQIFCRTSSYIMNTYLFFEKWLIDVKKDQTEDGGVSHVVPDIISPKIHLINDWLLSQGTHSAACWADVAVLNPWNLYLTYGDKQILIDQYESMKAWIGFMEAHADGVIWNYKLQFGDWVALDAAEGSYYGATPNDLTCTAYYAYSTGVFAKIAGILGREEDYAYYSALEQRIKDGFTEHFFDKKTKGMNVQTQTSHIIALYFGLTPEEYKEQTVKELLELLAKENGHLVTGFVGTPYFTHALSQNGYLKEAYELLLKDDFPSWLYQVKKGATTVWEHWDGMKPDGTMWSPDMNSFNHYAYGAIGEWLYRVIAGMEITEDAPGYKRSILFPRPGGNLSFAKGCLETEYGTLSCEWELCRKQMELTVTYVIPANTSAELYLENVEEILEDDGIDFELKEGLVKAQAQSGTYHVKVKLRQ